MKFCLVGGSLRSFDNSPERSGLFVEDAPFGEIHVLVERGSLGLDERVSALLLQEHAGGEEESDDCHHEHGAAGDEQGPRRLCSIPVQRLLDELRLGGYVADLTHDFGRFVDLVRGRTVGLLDVSGPGFIGDRGQFSTGSRRLCFRRGCFDVVEAGEDPLLLGAAHAVADGGCRADQDSQLTLLLGRPVPHVGDVTVAFPWVP